MAFLKFALAVLSFATFTSADFWCPDPYYAICTDTSQPGALAPFFSLISSAVPASAYAPCTCSPETSIFTSNYCCEVVMVSRETMSKGVANVVDRVGTWFGNVFGQELLVVRWLCAVFALPGIGVKEIVAMNRWLFRKVLIRSRRYCGPLMRHE
jgi:hypothetical protein